MILQALFGDIPQTAQMDVNQDGVVNIKDAEWILDHAN